MIGPPHTRFVSGLETWFTMPGHPGTSPPLPYKMALLTWITIFPLITAIVAVTDPLLEELPLALRLAIATALAVPLMTWIVMPRVTWLLHGWLYPGEGHAQSSDDVEGARTAKERDGRATRRA